MVVAVVVGIVAAEEQTVLVAVLVVAAEMSIDNRMLAIDLEWLCLDPNTAYNW